MAILLGRRFQLQLALISAAVLLVAVVSALLITEAVRGAERLVVAETGAVLAAAVDELSQQYTERSAVEGDWSGLAPELRDVSLRGVSSAVLRSYPGVEGGYYRAEGFLGYSFPTHNNPGKTDVPEAESGAIRAAAEQSLRTRRDVTTVIHGARDVVVIRARADASGAASWAMKRIVGLADPGPQHRRWLLAALVLLALLSLAATLATSLSLAHGVEEIKRGLGRIESDLGHNLPEREGELGEISCAVNRMIRHRQKLEAELHREDRLRSMGRLVAAVAHEVRNPLNGIRLSAQLLERQAGEGRQQVGAIIEEVDRLDRLVRELLIFEKSRSAKVEVQSLNAAIDGAWNLLRAQALDRGVSLEVDRTEDVPALFDAAALRQVLLNLMLNGIEAMPDGGRLTARMGAKSAWAEIRLANSGKPLAADVQEHLFEMFYSTKSEGAGLGLAVSRELTRSMRGTLEYDAAEAHPTFVIRLPQSNDAESHDTDRRG